MDSLILQDRATLQPISITIGDGVLTMSASAGTPVLEPIFADAQDGKYWRLFVTNGVLAWEEAEAIATGFIDLTDTQTEIPWRLFILGGQFAYSHTLSIATGRDSRVSQAGGRSSPILSTVTLQSDREDASRFSGLKIVYDDMSTVDEEAIISSIFSPASARASAREASAFELSQGPTAVIEGSGIARTQAALSDREQAIGSNSGFNVNINRESRVDQ